MAEEEQPIKKLDSTFKMIDKNNNEFIINKYLIHTTIGSDTIGTHTITNTEYETSNGQEVIEKDEKYSIGDIDLFLPS